jgi:hypothetical protein
MVLGRKEGRKRDLETRAWGQGFGWGGFVGLGYEDDPSLSLVEMICIRPLLCVCCAICASILIVACWTRCTS